MTVKSKISNITLFLILGYILLGAARIFDVYMALYFSAIFSMVALILYLKISSSILISKKDQFSTRWQFIFYIFIGICLLIMIYSNAAYLFDPELELVHESMKTRSGIIDPLGFSLRQ